MKTNSIYFLLLVILTSCSMSNSFNRQKFTSLKKIEGREVVETEKAIENGFDATMEEEEEFEEPAYSVFEVEPNTIEIEGQHFDKTTEFDQGPNDVPETSTESNHPVERAEPPNQSSKKHQKADEENSAETDRLLQINTIIFFIGIAGIIAQFLAFVAILFLDTAAIFTFTWSPIMFISLAGGIIGVGCLAAAFIIAMIYKEKCRRNGVNPKRGRWYSMWITSIILAAVFLGNLAFTVILALDEFF